MAAMAPRFALSGHGYTPSIHRQDSSSVAFLRNRLHCSKRSASRGRLVVVRAEAQVENEVGVGVESNKEVDVSGAGKQVQPENEDDGPTSMPSIDRRLEERFAVRDSGKYQCRSCGYVYDQAVGDPSYPIPPGVEFKKLPEDWRCSTCGAAKSFFNSMSIEVAGFAQNQNFGFGTNTLTSGQKSILIYGSLLFFFFLFLSGYFIQ